MPLYLEKRLPTRWYQKSCFVLGLGILLLGSLSVVSTARADSAGQQWVFVFLPAVSTPADFAQTRMAIETAGGRVVHSFPDQAVFAQISPQNSASLSSALPDAAHLFTGEIELSTMDVYGKRARRLADVWNGLLARAAGPVPVEMSIAEHPAEHQDAFLLPELPPREALVISGLENAPGYYDTSEFMAGSVAVGIVLVESNGTREASTEAWTADEKQLVFNEISNALDWWATLESRANLSFVYDDRYLANPLSVSIEPINHPQRDEGLWIGEAMSAAGFSSSVYYLQVFDYVNDLRRMYQTDWAFTIFVVDSSHDLDNKFSDGYFAYAYLGGPFMVLTYGNNGYGATNMDAVAAHEIGHIFNALDQYAAAGFSCSVKSGYLQVENQNSQYGTCASNVPSIMRGQVYPYSARTIDAYAAGQIGWRDSDGDNILDPLDTTLPVTIETISQTDNVATVQGTAQLLPFPAAQGASLTINDLRSVQYRVDGGPWQPASSVDGLFDGQQELYHFTVNNLTPGEHTLEVSAVDSAGNWSEQFAVTQITVSDVDHGLNTELHDLSQQSEPLKLSGVAYHQGGGIVTGVEYRIDGGVWQPAVADDGAFDSANEPFAINLSELQAMDAERCQVEARAIDESGYVELSTAVQEVQLQNRMNFSTFLPLIIQNN